MRQSFDALSLTPPNDAQTKRIVGLELHDACAQLAPAGADIDALVEGYKQAFLDNRAKGLENSPMYAGAMEALKRLDHGDTLLGIATGKARRGLDHMFSVHDIRHHFTVTQTMDEGPGKPNPGMIYNALRDSGVEPENAVMIGDTTFDVQMAVNAGIRAIGVDWGYHEAQELLDTGAERVLTHFDELLETEIWP